MLDLSSSHRLCMTHIEVEWIIPALGLERCLKWIGDMIRWISHKFVTTSSIMRHCAQLFSLQTYRQIYIFLHLVTQTYTMMNLLSYWKWLKWLFTELLIKFQVISQSHGYFNECFHTYNRWTSLYTYTCMQASTRILTKMLTNPY